MYKNKHKKSVAVTRLILLLNIICIVRHTERPVSYYTLLISLSYDCRCTLQAKSSNREAPTLALAISVEAANAVTPTAPDAIVSNTKAEATSLLIYFISNTTFHKYKI